MNNFTAKAKILTLMLTLLSLMLACSLLYQFGQLTPFILPKPSAIFASGMKNLSWLLESLQITLTEAVVGYLLGIAIGIALTVLCVFVPILEVAVTPVTVGIINIPFVAVAPILFRYFGFGPSPKIVIVLWLSFFPVMSNFIAGIKSAKPALRKRFFVKRATRWVEFKSLLLPSSIPNLIVGLEVAGANIIITAIVGELLGTFGGLGHALRIVMSQYSYETMYFIALMITLVSIVQRGAISFVLRTTLRKYYLS